MLAAVEGAHVVIYLGHGYGHPSPYGGLNTARQNGWGLQGPAARGTHSDGLNGELAYYGEDWIVANARPAPGFVLIYSNVCYAPGASEGGFPAATERMALERVAHYSRKVFRMGGSAYYATDFDHGAAGLVGRILANRHVGYGDVFASDSRYVPSALRAYAHPFAAGQQVWLHRSKYTDGPPNYWYAFAGNPAAVPARSWDPTAPTLELASAVTDVRHDARIELQVSESVTGLGSETLRLVDAAGTVVPADVTVDVAARTVTVTPHHDLPLSTSYRLQVTTGIADHAGNPMAPREWLLTTRLDVDPRQADVPVVLATGAHELVRVDAHGATVESRSLDVVEERWVAAGRRARLPGRSGSWLELRGGGLDGWWLAESSRAGVPGVLDVAALDAGTTVSLAPGDYGVVDIAGMTVTAAGELATRSPRTVAVDRRAVVDGTIHVRAASTEGPLAGRWIQVPMPVAPGDAVTQRITGSIDRPEPATLDIGLGDWTLFRFDGRGRVVDRMTISGGRTATLATSRTVEIGGASFFVIDGGQVAGWAVRQDPAHSVTVVQPASAE